MRALSIAIAGAGVGGLAAAALLADLGHRVTVFDQFDAPRPIGSGLVLQPVGQAVLDHLGAGAAARALGTPIRRMLGHEADTGRRVLDVHYDRAGGPRHGLGIHRGALFAVLLEAAEARGVTLETSARVTGREGQRLWIGDRLTPPFDLIVDACGAGSPLTPLTARALPYGAVWSTVDWPVTALPRDQLSQVYRRADRMIGALPVGRLPGDPAQKAAVFWSLPVAGYAGWQTAGLAAWKAEAVSLWPEFAPFLASITDPGQMTMARYAHGTLIRPWSDGIVHIGDAAHRASPQLGQGANMALLDAQALAAAVARHPWSLPDALAAYGMARRWHVWAYQAFSAAFTPQYQSDSRFLPLVRDRIMFPLSQIPPATLFLTALVSGTMLPPLGSLSPARTTRSAPVSQGL